MEDEDILEFKVAVGDALGVEVVDCSDDLSQGCSLLGDVWLGGDEVVEETALLGVFKDEDVVQAVRRRLLILLITLESHSLAVLVARDDVGVVQALQDGVLVSEVFLLPGRGAGHCLEDQSVLLWPVGVDGGVVATRQQ